MNVYMWTDLEGVAGLTSFVDETYGGAKYYEQAKRLLTAEVNAAVEGLLQEGVTDVLVGDWHGPGGIWFEDLHPAARLMHGRPIATWRKIQEVLGRYDVCMIVGQHAMAGEAEGTLNHTQNSRAIDYYKLNGRAIGELAQIALLEGALGKPMIFVSGDEAACAEAAGFIPGITTAAVKEGLSRNSAISLSAAESRRRIREGVRLAVQRQRSTPVAPLVWPGPYVLEKRFFTSDAADAAANAPGVVRLDGQTVQLRSDDIKRVIFW
jgi:D-amino peptidase